MDRLLWLESDLTSEQIAETSQATLGVALHPLALEHLSDSSLSLQFPFPRLEKHESYLFGTLLIPSNIQNPSADFDALVFAVTHDAVVATVFCHPTSERDWLADRETLFAIDTTDSTPDGGQFILNCLQHTRRYRTRLRFCKSPTGNANTCWLSTACPCSSSRAASGVDAQTRIQFSVDSGKIPSSITSMHMKSGVGHQASDVPSMTVYSASFMSRPVRWSLTST